MKIIFKPYWYLKFLYTKYQIKKAVNYLCNGYECFVLKNITFVNYPRYIKQVDDIDNTNVYVSYISPKINIKISETNNRKSIKQYNKDIKFVINLIANYNKFNVIYEEDRQTIICCIH